MTSKLSDFYSAGKAKFKDLGTVTGTVTLDFNKYQAYKIVQGAGDLTVEVDTSKPETRAEARLLLEKHPDWSVTFTGAELHDVNLPTSGVFDLSEVAYDGMYVDGLANTGTQPVGIAFATDNNKCFILGNTSTTSNILFRYDVFSDGSLIYDGYQLDVSPQDSSMQDVAVHPDGNKLYTVGMTNDRIYVYDIAKDYTLTFTGVVGGVTANPRGVAAHPDGTHIYVVGQTEDKIYIHPINANYGLGSSIGSLLISGEDGEPHGLAIDPSGTKLLMVGSSSDTIHQYSIAGDYTLSYDTVSLSVSGQSTSPGGVAVDPNTSAVWLASAIPEEVHRYSTGLLLNKKLSQKLSQYGSSIGITSEELDYEFV